MSGSDERYDDLDRSEEPYHQTDVEPLDTDGTMRNLAVEPNDFYKTVFTSQDSISEAISNPNPVSLVLATTEALARGIPPSASFDDDDLDAKEAERMTPAAPEAPEAIVPAEIPEEKPQENSEKIEENVDSNAREVTNIPASVLDDQFGMAGLVTYLQTVDNPKIMEEMGLRFSEDGILIRSRGGPMADSPIRAHELDVKVPDEYLTHNHIRDKLPPLRLNEVSEDVLFYLFYNCPNEIYQLAAKCELYHREWRFHRSDQNWLIRSQDGGVREQTDTYEKGHYNVFDQMQWRKIPRELKLEYKELEEKPKLPQAVAGNAGQQQLGGVPGGNGGAPGPAPMQMQPKNKMMKSDPTLTNSEFQRQKEDSHALPGVDGSMVEDQLETMRCSNCNELINIPVFEAHTKKCKKQ